MSYRIVPCPKCNRLHGVVAVRASTRRRPVAPLQDAGTTPETPRDGRDVLAVRSSPDDPASRSSQAASQLPLALGGAG